MKKHFITLGALSLMLLVSPSEVKAKTPSSQTNPAATSQGVIHRHTLTFWEFEGKILTIISEMMDIDIAFIDQNETFKEAGFDSIDYIDFNNEVENELGINRNYIGEYYHYTIRKFIKTTWIEYNELNNIQ